MHSHSPETVLRASDLRGPIPLRPLTLTSPPQKPAEPSTDPSPAPSNPGPKSPVQVIPLTSPPFRPHNTLSSSPPEPISLPPSTVTVPKKKMPSVPVEASPDILFSPTLISAEVGGKLPQGYAVRPLRRTDYAAGMLEVLKVLTTVGEISEGEWVARFDWMKKREGDYYLIVIEDGSGRIVGTGCVVVERKFIHNLGLVGHIEDIAVAKDQQGKKLGLYLIQSLDHIAKEVGCYKTILDCSEENEGFYLKCGFKRAGLEMSHYH